MRWQRLKPEELAPVGNTGAFTIGLRITKQWLRPVLAAGNIQAVVDVTHVAKLVAHIAPIKRAMRAGRTDTLNHECGEIFPHYVARFALYDIGGVPCCVLTGWQGARKYFTLTLRWRDLTDFERALVALRKLANGYVKGARKHEGGSTSI